MEDNLGVIWKSAQEYFELNGGPFSKNYRWIDEGGNTNSTWVISSGNGHSLFTTDAGYEEFNKTLIRRGLEVLKKRKHYHRVRRNKKAPISKGPANLKGRWVGIKVN